MALAFVQGIDPAAMHVWLPMATHLVAQRSPADERAQQTLNDLAELQQLEPSALKELVLSELKSEAEAKISSEAAHGSVQPENPLEAMLGPFLAASQMQGHAQQNPLEQLIGDVMGCKGMGKGDGTFNPSGANPLDMLGQLGQA